MNLVLIVIAQHVADVLVQEALMHWGTLTRSMSRCCIRRAVGAGKAR